MCDIYSRKVFILLDERRPYLLLYVRQHWQFIGQIKNLKSRNISITLLG